MKKLFLIPFILLAVLFTATAWADTHNAASCSYDDVNAAITAASEGDTVTVPAGNCEWGSQLLITKAITLQGAGAGYTNISTPSGGLGSGIFMVRYEPSNSANDIVFYMSGFTFDAKSISVSLGMYSGDYTHLARVRIHHNTFSNVRFSDGNQAGFRSTSGTIIGVFDNNIITGTAGFLWHNDAGQAANWTYLTFAYATQQTMYIENNYIDAASAGWGNNSEIIGCGWGGRFVARYNTFVYSGDGLSPWFDSHGCRTDGTYGCMGLEVYGNKLTSSTLSGNNLKFFHHWGGQGLFFYNKATAAGATMYAGCSNDFPTTNCPAPGTDHVNNSYIWNNRGNSTRIDMGLDYDCCGEIAENSEWYNQKGSFDGTSGMGCGILGSRPATCTTGVAYWATDQGCDSVSDSNIGQNPATLLSGTLYKCTATNIWTAYYTPLAFPHPLVIGEPTDIDPPAFPGPNYPSGEVACDAETPVNITLSFPTNENADCGYSPTVIPFADMTLMSSTGGMSHSQTVSVACDAAHNYNFKCRDKSLTQNINTDANDLHLPFSVAPTVGDVTPPVMSNPLPLERIYLCDTNPRNITLEVSATDETPPITCKACKSGLGGCTSATAYADMTMEGAVTFDAPIEGVHKKSVSVPCGGSGTYYSRCTDSVGSPNVNTTSQVHTYTIGNAIPSDGIYEAESGSLGPAVINDFNSETYYVDGEFGHICGAPASCGSEAGQSFFSKGGILSSVKFYLKKVGSPTGNATAKVYTHSGTFGVSSIPTGVALATSDNYNVATIGTDMGLITLTFSGAEKIAQVKGTNYVVVFSYSGGDADNYIAFGRAATYVAHSGNYTNNMGGWAAYNDKDAIFYVYTDTFLVVTDASAHGGQYLKAISDAKGSSTYTVAVGTTGTYRVIGVVYAIDTGGDSLYFKVDSDAEIIWELASGGYNAWKPLLVNSSGASYQVALAAGNHTFVVSTKEEGARIDYLYLESVDVPPQPPMPQGLMIVGSGGTMLVGIGGTMIIE